MTASTTFLTADEHGVLEYIRRKPASPEEISTAVEIGYSKCLKFLKRMVRSGYVVIGSHVSISNVKSLNQSFLYERFSLPILSAPIIVDVFVTNRCNLDCVHCFSSEIDQSASELSIGELESVFVQLEELGVFEVRINGGEPFLHSNIHDILRILRGRRFKKVLLTNGTLLDRRTITLLKEAQITPTVSLDGSNAEQHDQFRGVSGSFDRTVNSLRLLHSERMEYGINCCLHRMNIEAYDRIIELAVDCGARRIAFLDLKTAGRMKKDMEWIPSYNEYLQVLPNLIRAKIRAKTKIDVSLDAFLHCYIPEECVEEAKKGFVSCRAGRTILSIGSDGAAYPCNLAVTDQRWSAGDVRRERILDIWFSPKWKFFRGEVKMSDLDKCQSCRNRSRCRDFYCRLAPYMMSGDPLGPHPRCV
jgi:radical SAM protein with 4Fe4S-binding SPASM domain